VFSKENNHYQKLILPIKQSLLRNQRRSKEKLSQCQRSSESNRWYPKIHYGLHRKKSWENTRWNWMLVFLQLHAYSVYCTQFNYNKFNVNTNSKAAWQEIGVLHPVLSCLYFYHSYHWHSSLRTL